MITGRRAFQAETKTALLDAIVREESQPVHEIAAGVPREVERVVLHCLRKDPSRRLQHMDDVKTLLEELKEEMDSGQLDTGTRIPVRSREAETPAETRPGWSLAIRIAAALVLLVIVGIVASWLTQSP